MQKCAKKAPLPLPFFFVILVSDRVEGDETVKRTILGLLLILLALLLFLRAGFLLHPAPAAPAAATAALPEPTAEPSPEPAWEPTPEPSPAPTPEPTPRPLREVVLSDYRIDASFFEPAAERGSLLTDVAYTTPDYVYGAEGAFPKYMQVYLPYGYDRESRYDVLFLFPVMGNTERFWLELPHAYSFPEGDAYVDAVCLLDNLIERGFCRPMLVVSLNGYLDEEAQIRHRSEQTYPQMTREFAEVILPYVAEHFATWAEGGSREQLREARGHFGVLGASFGAYMTELSVLAPNLDLVSWYAMTGGGSVSREYLEPSWAGAGTVGLPVDMLYFAEGDGDDIGPVAESYWALARWEEVFTAEENLRFTQILETGHSETEWVTALYNTAQLFFR